MIKSVVKVSRRRKQKICLFPHFLFFTCMFGALQNHRAELFGSSFVPNNSNKPLRFTEDKIYSDF